MRLWPSRLATYVAELRLCLLIGADYSSRFRLTVDTCLFHIANGLSIPQSYQSRPQVYCVSLGGKVHSLQLRPLGGDFFVFHEIFLGECYRLPVWYQPKSATIVDLGANIGLTTLYYYRQFPDATFICVEPDPTNLSLLRVNCASLQGQTILIEGAVSDQTGSVYFVNDQASWGGKIVQHSAHGIQIPCYDINNILSHAGNNPIDLLKIDIEGAEEAIFATPCPWLGRVKMIIIELHSELGVTNFRRAVHEAGFRVLEPDPAQGTKMLIAYQA